MDELSYQQTAIFERLRENDKTLREANGAIGARATVIATSSSLVAGLMGSAELLPGGGVASGFSATCVLIVFVLCLAIYWHVAQIWKNSANNLAGDVTKTVDELWATYISQKADVTFDRMLIDLQDAAAKNLAENGVRYASLRRAIYLFMLQLTVLLVAVIGPPVWALF